LQLDELFKQQQKQSITFYTHTADQQKTKNSIYL
jgi:hypothetical protein